jgi:hypothetical protein
MSTSTYQSNVLRPLSTRSNKPSFRSASQGDKGTPSRKRGDDRAAGNNSAISKDNMPAKMPESMSPEVVVKSDSLERIVDSSQPKESVDSDLSKGIMDGKCPSPIDIMESFARLLDDEHDAHNIPCVCKDLRVRYRRQGFERPRCPILHKCVKTHSVKKILRRGGVDPRAALKHASTNAAQTSGHVIWENKESRLTTCPHGTQPEGSTLPATADKVLCYRHCLCGRLRNMTR